MIAELGFNVVRVRFNPTVPVRPEARRAALPGTADCRISPRIEPIRLRRTFLCKIRTAFPPRF